MGETAAQTARQTPHHRRSFYIGGQYVKDKEGNHSLQGQMYVEHLQPSQSSEIKPFPLLFIHGGTRTGIVSRLLLPLWPAWMLIRSRTG